MNKINKMMRKMVSAGVVGGMLFTVGCGTDTASTNNTTVESKENDSSMDNGAAVETPAVEETSEQKAEKSMKAIIDAEINGQVTNTTLDSLTINQNSGTDADDDVIVLANLTWSTANKEKTTREMLKMYSDHLAAKMAPELANGSEIALFWKAEYTGLDIKHSYVVRDGNAYIQ